MSTNRILKRIGGKLREDSSDIVEVELPEPVRALLRKLAGVDGLDKIAADYCRLERR